MLYVLSVLMLFLSGHPLTTVPNNFWFIAYLTAFGIAAILVVARGTIEVQWLLNRLALLFLLVFFTLIYGDVNPVANKFILFFMLALIITMISSEEHVLITVATANFHLMVLSLVSYIVINLMKIEVPAFSFINVNGVPYRSIMIYNWFDNILFFRNTGFFWEPGLLATQALLTTAIFAKYNRLFTHRKILIALVVISTFSIFGILLLLFLVSKNLSQNLVLIALGIGSFFILEYQRQGSILQYIDVVTRKFYQNSASIDERVSSTKGSATIFMDNPLGIGIGNFYEIYQEVGSPLTNSIMSLAASYPVFLLILGVALVCRIYKQGFAESRVIMIILLAASKEPLLFSMITIVICLGFPDERYYKTGQRKYSFFANL